MQQPAKLGITLFIIAESVFFFMLMVAFVAFRPQSVVDASKTLSLPLASISTGCLLASSFTVWRAARAMSSPDTAKPHFWLVTTAALGSLFLVGQGSEYARLVKSGTTISRNLFGTTFFTLTGMLLLHVILGILLLIALQRSMGTMSALSTMPAQSIRTVAAFWHFIVAVSAVIFLVVYLWTFL
jgi:heme/copper-type cytochrome/quinol oxidase subunit 3